jgi:TolA-binding protein
MFSSLKHSWIILTVVLAFVFAGCGESEETVKDASGSRDSSQEAKPKPETKVNSKSSMDQALTSFVGEEPVHHPAPEKPPVVVSDQTPKLSQYEKEIEGLRAENADLKQRNGKLEEDSRLLNTRLSENEARLAGTAAPQREEAKVPAGSYEDALKTFQAKNYNDAIQQFQAIIDGGAPDNVADHCKYWIGEAHFAAKQYQDALGDFEAVLKYKNIEKKGDAQFMLGQTYEKLGSKAKAKAAYKKLIKEYPMNKNVKRAKARRAKL